MIFEEQHSLVSQPLLKHVLAFDSSLHPKKQEVLHNTYKNKKTISPTLELYLLYFDISNNKIQALYSQKNHTNIRQANQWQKK